jgi:hypothetical protein
MELRHYASASQENIAATFVTVKLVTAPPVTAQLVTLVP